MYPNKIQLIGSNTRRINIYQSNTIHTNSSYGLFVQSRDFNATEDSTNWLNGPPPCV